jgi:hypothetical protein
VIMIPTPTVRIRRQKGSESNDDNRALPQRVYNAILLRSPQRRGIHARFSHPKCSHQCRRFEATGEAYRG